MSSHENYFLMDVSQIYFYHTLCRVYGNYHYFVCVYCYLEVFFMYVYVYVYVMSKRFYYSHFSGCYFVKFRNYLPEGKDIFDLRDLAKNPTKEMIFQNLRNEFPQNLFFPLKGF